MKRQSHQENGFTLIELLVVISIIALLLSILLPSMSRAKAQGRTVLCLSHLQQLSNAMHLYTNQNLDYVPQVYGGPVGWLAKRGALYRMTVESGMLADTDEYPDLLVCPDTQPRGALSYALNAVVFGYETQNLGPDGRPKDEGTGDTAPDDSDEDNPFTYEIPPLKLSRVKSPGKVVALYDVNIASLGRVWNSSLHTDESDLSDQFTGNGMLGTARPNPAGFMWQESLDEDPFQAKSPHDSGHNILFVDGHASTHSQWQPGLTTRLTGSNPNDDVLH